MKKILAVMLCLAMVLCMVACGAENKTTDTQDTEKQSDTTDEATKNDETVKDYDNVIKNGKLVIGITEYEPMNYMENGKWTGFDTEFAEAVCEMLGVTAEFREIEWENKYIELESGTIDCIWNGMTLCDETYENASCSDPYVINAQVVVMDKDKVDSYNDTESMKELTFAVESGSAGQEAGTACGFDVVEYTAQSDAMMAVQSGKADACIIDITMANAMTGEGTSYEDLAVSFAITEEEYGIAFRKNSDLTEIVNGFMKELINDGTLIKLAEKYNLTLYK